MICSALTSICIASGAGGIAATRLRNPGSNRVGSAALLSLASNLSASSCRADSAARSSGDAPNRTSATPVSFKAVSSNP